MREQTNNVNKTRALLPTTGGNDESGIGLMWKSYQRSQHGTQNVKTHNRTTQKLWVMNEERTGL